jgi:sodium-dependent dicarboxylate transporter 2/3/5
LLFPFDRLGFVLGPIMLVGWLMTEPGSLTPEAHRLAGIMLLTMLWWITEPIPTFATGLLAVGLCVVLQAVPADKGRLDAMRTALAPLADPAVFFLMGGLFLGRAMTRHGLDRRLALSILCTRWAGSSPGSLLAGVGLSVMLMSMWISNTAATAMMYPVTLGIISVLAAGTADSSTNLARSPYASALLMITAYASSVGGIATPIGTATNVVAIGYFRQPEYFGRPIDFLSWSLVGVPMMLCIFCGLFFWLRRLAPSGHLNLLALREYLQDERSRLGPWSRGEVNTLVVFAIVVGLWITPGVLGLIGATQARQAFSSRCPEEITALLVPVLFYLVPVNWRRREFTLDRSDFTKIDWGSLVLFGAGLSLGGLMFKTGLALAVGEAVFAMVGSRDVSTITAIAVCGGIFLSEFTGNAPAASTLIPVVLAIARQANIDPLPPLLGVTFGASFGSALPVSTPPNAIVYSSGLLPVRRMIVAGVGLDLLCAVVIWTALYIAHACAWNPFVTRSL